MWGVSVTVLVSIYDYVLLYEKVQLEKWQVTQIKRFSKEKSRDMGQNSLFVCDFSVKK